MSGVVKGVKKTFSKVTKVVKKVAPIALAGAAVVFTAGSALGLTAGWGAISGGLTQSLGLTGTLGNILTGSLTQAGYGAVIGAATSAVTGGDISRGAMLGAAGGAVSGGVMGGLGMPTDPLASSSSASSGTAAPTAATPSMENLTSPQISGAPSIGDVGDGLMQTARSAPASAPVGGGSSMVGDVLGKGGWLERNGELVGGLAKGVGQGLLSGMSDQAQIDAAAARQTEIQNNYRVGGGGLMPTARTGGPAYDASNNPSPAERYPSTVQRQPTVIPTSGRMRYVYNRATGRMEITQV